MEPVLKRFWGFAFFVLLFSLIAVNSTKIDNGDDRAFKTFLTEAMSSYPTWLKKNDLDPSPLTNTNGVVLKIYQGVHLECNISNHYISGHSQPGVGDIGKFSFKTRILTVGRTLLYAHEFHGDFKCTGTLKAYSYSDLDNKDLSFRGNGKFHITAYNSAETMTLHNVGIGQDYKLDLSNSESAYLFETEHQTAHINGIWDSPLINNKYLYNVSDAFAYMHKRITKTDQHDHRSFPPGKLLDRYIRRMIKSVKVRVSNDVLFVNYLNGCMHQYSDWLKEQHLDPYQMTNGVMEGEHGRVQLKCSIYNHFMQGHSNDGQNLVGSSESNFAQHKFSMGRTIQDLYEFHGKFTCTGSLTSHYYDQWTNDIIFQGSGEFFITANYSFEFLTMNNVGITPEYKLDFTHSTATFLLPASQMICGLTTKWNETLLNSGSTHLDIVSDAFANIYKNFTEEDHPSSQLLKLFMRKATRRLNLKSIIDEEDLPEPFIPLPPPPPKPSTEEEKAQTEHKNAKASGTTKRTASQKRDIISFLRTIMFAVGFYYFSSYMFGKSPTIKFMVCLGAFLVDRLL